MKINWLKDGQPVEINRNGRFILSNENSLLIAQIKVSDAGNYTCVASNIVGTYSSEPAELIVHGKSSQRKTKLVKLDLLDDRGWSEWQSFSDCKGIPCSIGRQRRIRTCLNPPTITNRPSCDGDQIQERECQVLCPKDSSSPTGVLLPGGMMRNQSEGDLSRISFVYLEDGFSDWSPWTDCMGKSCQIGRQQRLRACLKPTIIDGKKSTCNGEQIQERDCTMPCSNKNASFPIRSFSKGENIFFFFGRKKHFDLLNRHVFQLDRMVRLSTIGLYNHTYTTMFTRSMSGIASRKSIMSRKSLFE